MKIRSLLFCLLAVFTSLNTAADSKKVKTLRMGSEGAYPPFNTVDKKGNLIGFDIDIGNALCDAMKVKCVWVRSDWDGLIPSLLSKKFDTIIASMSITEERKKRISFTEKYYTTPIQFAQEKGAKIAITKKGLKGKTVGVQGGVVSENLVKNLFGDVVTLKTYGSQEELNLDFISGRVDLVAADSFILQDFLQTKDGAFAEITGPSFDDPKYIGEGIGIGLRQSDTDLKEKLNNAIKKIRADGTYQQINKKYFSFDIYEANDQ